MKEEYRKEVIELVKSISSEKRLKQLYTIALHMHEREIQEKVKENDQSIL